MYNRARGLELISPEDLLAAVKQFERVGANLEVRVRKSATDWAVNRTFLRFGRKLSSQRKGGLASLEIAVPGASLRPAPDSEQWSVGGAADTASDGVSAHSCGN